MSGAAQLALAVIAFGAAWLSLSPLALLAFRAANPLIAHLEPRRQSTLLFALACLPLAVAALVAVLGFAPGVGGWVVERHCHADVGCWPHVPALQGGAAQATLLGALLLTAGGAGLWTLGAGVRRAGALTAMLGSLADARGDGPPAASKPRPPFKIVESDEPWAACIGLLRPEVLVSRGLVERLSTAQLDAVLAHEAAHAARLDNLRRLLANLSLRLLPRRFRHELERALAAADERACDREAAERVGGPAAVVDALLAAVDAATPHGAAASSVAERAAALHAEPRAALPPAVVTLLAWLLYAACTLAAVQAAHHGSELLLAWLAW